MQNWKIFMVFSLSLGMILANFAEKSFADIQNDVKIEHIYTKPWYDQYQYSFKIFADENPVGPYKLSIQSDVDLKIIDGDYIVKPNSWVQWFIYIEAEDPNSIKVEILSS